MSLSKTSIALTAGAVFFFTMIGLFALAEGTGEKRPAIETIEISKTEYEALQHDAEAYRKRHRVEGMASQIIEVFGIRITPWKLLGYIAALLFSGRWFIQMYYSRKAGRPVIPRAYWVVSIVASLMLLSYWTLSPQRASVGVLQNLFPSFVAAYNLYLDIRYHRTNGAAPLDKEEDE